ncbi:hypothetical protein EES47_18140 [Streptomyces sp. ADI98-12]|nr:hypothetical protein EES47_18140 [Streptomyces sp. ADI98-12]
MGCEVGDAVAGPQGDLDDGGAPAVAVYVVPGAVADVLGHAGERRVRAGFRHDVDAGARDGPADRVRGARLDGDAQLRGGLGEGLGESGDVSGHLHPTAAEVGAVQRDLEIGAQFVEYAGECPGLGRQTVRRHVRRGPFGLFGAARTVEAPVVLQERAGGAHLVQARSVGVGAEQEVPGGAGTQGGVGRDASGQPAYGRSARRFVGVGSRDDQDGRVGVADGEQVQRAPRAGEADPAQGTEPGVAVDQRGGGADQLGGGREALGRRVAGVRCAAGHRLLVLGHARPPPPVVRHRRPARTRPPDVHRTIRRAGARGGAEHAVRRATTPTAVRRAPVYGPACPHSSWRWSRATGRRAKRVASAASPSYRGPWCGRASVSRST